MLNNLFTAGCNKKCWKSLLDADVITFFATRKCQKIRKIDENS